MYMYIVDKISNMTMRYTQWNYITVKSFVFTSAIVGEVRLLKRKKNNDEKINKPVKGTF